MSAVVTSTPFAIAYLAFGVVVCIALVLVALNLHDNYRARYLEFEDTAQSTPDPSLGEVGESGARCGAASAGSTARVASDAPISRPDSQRGRPVSALGGVTGPVEVAP